MIYRQSKVLTVTNSKAGLGLKIDLKKQLAMLIGICLNALFISYAIVISSIFYYRIFYEYVWSIEYKPVTVFNAHPALLIE